MKEYLGDGCYVEVDEFGAVVLTTWNGIRDTNRIVLEPEVLQAFERYIAELRKRVTEGVAP